jgi:glycerophosphoryl diester phosphodiesterase
MTSYGEPNRANDTIDRAEIKPPDSSPLIIGHRGNSHDAPENTLLSFHSAMSAGADGIEFDVRLARDSVPVCIHDATLERTGRIAARVEQLTASELENIEVGSWFNERHPRRARPAYARECIPTLDRVFTEMRAYDRKNLYVELKCTESEAEALAREVIKRVREHALGDGVVIESFTLAAIAAVKRAAPELRTAALFERTLTNPFPSAQKIMTLVAACGADEIALQSTLVNRRIIASAKQAHFPVVVWTVDSQRWLRRAREFNLQALITNRPSLLISERHKL